MSEPADRRPRRPRYRGTHPCAFAEKYKEHHPDLFADEVTHVLASGKTPAGSHRPVMVDEVLRVLAPIPGDDVVDCTLGYGGHAIEFLKAIQPGGRLLGMDVDPIELPKTELRLQSLEFPADSIIARRTNFAGIVRATNDVFPEGANIILADLGTSSMQLDDPLRGFTFKADAPLDMRMNPRHGQSASQLLTHIDPQELTRLLVEYADELHAARLAKAILEQQSKQPIQTTIQLADVVRTTVQSVRGATTGDSNATVRRVFQALRIAVNDELGALESLLKQIPDCLKPGGRVAILTFHSGEDRRVKKFFQAGMRAGIYVAESKFLLRPTPEEQRSNPRSAPAKLRFARRV